jgi:SSS family solute:Na+ symporter
MVLAVIISPFLGIEKGGFKFIQEYTGFVSPGIFAMFILGFFWKRTTSSAALFATIGGFILSIVLKFLPEYVDLSFLYSMGFAVPVTGVYEIPFLDRMGFVFLFSIIGMFFISKLEYKDSPNPKGLEVDASMFKPTAGFTVGAVLIIGILVALYTVFW